jgi:hypothetical protein
MLLATLGAVILLSLSSATANAQLQNPSQQEFNRVKAQGPCADAWITLAIWFNNGGTSNPRGVANAGECDPKMYGGSWSSYDELTKLVNAARHDSNYPSFYIASDGRVGGTTWVLMLRNGNVVAQQPISNDFISHNGSALALARIIAAGGGNIVAHDGGTLTVGNSKLATRNGDVLGIVIDNTSNIVIDNTSNIRQLRSFSFSPAAAYSIKTNDPNRLPRSRIVIN